MGLGLDGRRIRGHHGAFLERGGNFIDTANGYTRGHSEKIIGDLLGRDRARRDRMVIATKFFSNLYQGDPNGGGAGRKAIVASCEQSLRRLQTDYIDLYWMHLWDKFTPIEETMRALDDLVQAGKVRYIGFSDTPAWKVAQAQTIAQFRGWTPLVALQIEYSLLERTVEGELIPMALELGLGVTPWSPLRGGVLTGKYTRENARRQGRSRRARHGVSQRALLRIIDELVASRTKHGDAGRGRAGLGAASPAWRRPSSARGPRSARSEPRGARPGARRGRYGGARSALGAGARFPHLFLAMQT